MNINDINRRNAMSFAEELKRGNSVLSEVERIKRDFGLSGVSDELRRAKLAMAERFQPSNHIAGRLKEAEDAIRNYREMAGRPFDNLARRKSAFFEDVTNAVSRRTMLVDEMTNTVARKAEAFKFVKSLTARPRELFVDVAKEYGKRFDELLGVAGRAQNARDLLASMHDSYGIHNQLAEIRHTQFEDMRREHIMRDSVRHTVASYRPVEVELPKLAEQRIKSIEQEEKEKRENLPIGKSLEMSVIAGGMQFRVQGYEAFSAKDRLMVEIRTIGGDVTLSVPHDQIITLYQEVDILDTHPGTIH